MEGPGAAAKDGTRMTFRSRCRRIPGRLLPSRRMVSRDPLVALGWRCLDARRQAGPHHAAAGQEAEEGSQLGRQVRKRLRP